LKWCSHASKKAIFSVVLVRVFTFAFVTGPMFIRVLMFMPPTNLARALYSPADEHSPADERKLAAAVIAAQLTADQRGIFKGERSR
jgi:hypothetical protein